MGRDTKIRDAVRNEGGVESAHYARGSRETDELHRVRRSDRVCHGSQCADDHQATKRQPIRRAKKGLKRLRTRTGSKTVNQEVIKSKVNAVVTLARASRPSKNGQGDCSVSGG